VPLLQDKKAIVFGVANDHSIAWAIAQALQREGADLAFTYIGESIERRVRPLAASIGVNRVLPCDVSKDDEIAATFAALREQWGRVDIVIHAVAFALRDELKGRFLDTSRDGFHVAMDISAFSLVAIARHAQPLMSTGGSLLTLTYLGAERVLPNYNVMGHRGFESTRSRRGRCAHSPPRVLPASRACCTITKSAPRYVATSCPKRWRTRPSTCAAISGAA
jgi:enoyl-[acyl-carrier protein] reductase I